MSKTAEITNSKKENSIILLMTTAPPEKGAWYLGKRLPPIGLMYVGAALERSGFQVQMLDNYLLKKSIEEIKQIIVKIDPQIVGITCGSATYPRTVETAKAIKQVKPDCTIVVGGWHASYMPDSLLSNPEIDYVIMGEGERAMTELASALTNKNEKAIPSIAGLSFRESSLNVKNQPKFIENMGSSFS